MSSNPHFPVLLFHCIPWNTDRHQTAGKASAADILDSNEDGYQPLDGNEKGQKCIRLLTVGGEGKSDSDGWVDCGAELSAVIAAHPASFTNEIFLRGSVPNLESVRTAMNVFSKLRVPTRVVVRGYDAPAACKVHDVLISAGLVQVMKASRVMVLNLDPLPIEWKNAKDMLPPGHDIIDVGLTRDADERSKQISELASLIVTSYGFPNVERRGQTPSAFLGQAYEGFEHAGDLRHFACIDRESGEMTSCVALFCDRKGELGRPDIAAMYNVCTSPKHRRKGLGTAMTVLAIEEAKKMGCKQVLLEASKNGKPLYESMGFTMMEDETGGVYMSLSIATDSLKWKSAFRLLELWMRLKNEGVWHYFQRR